MRWFNYSFLVLGAIVFLVLLLIVLMRETSPPMKEQPDGGIASAVQIDGKDGKESPSGDIKPGNRRAGTDIREASAIAGDREFPNDIIIPEKGDLSGIGPDIANGQPEGNAGAGNNTNGDSDSHLTETDIDTEDSGRSKSSSDKPKISLKIRVDSSDLRRLFSGSWKLPLYWPNSRTDSGPEERRLVYIRCDESANVPAGTELVVVLERFDPLDANVSEIVHTSRFTTERENSFIYDVVLRKEEWELVAKGSYYKLRVSVFADGSGSYDVEGNVDEIELVIGGPYALMRDVTKYLESWRLYTVSDSRFSETNQFFKSYLENKPPRPDRSGTLLENMLRAESAYAKNDLELYVEGGYIAKKTPGHFQAVNSAYIAYLRSVIAGTEFMQTGRISTATGFNPCVNFSEQFALYLDCRAKYWRCLLQVFEVIDRETRCSFKALSYLSKADAADLFRSLKSRVAGIMDYARSLKTPMLYSLNMVQWCEEYLQNFGHPSGVNAFGTPAGKVEAMWRYFDEKSFMPRVERTLEVMEELCGDLATIKMKLEKGGAGPDKFPYADSAILARLAEKDRFFDTELDSLDRFLLPVK